MRTQADFLDLARERAGLPSDYALAKNMGVSRQRVSQLRSGTTPLSPVQADALGQLCGIDGGIIYAEVKAVRAKRKEVRRFWERVARGLAAGMILTISATWPGGEARAVSWETAAVQHVLYIMRTWLARLVRRRRRPSSRKPIAPSQFFIGAAAGGRLRFADG